MNNRDEILKEILSDSELMNKYGIKQNDLESLSCAPSPGKKKIVEIMSTIINEMDNNRTPRQIYPILKNIHKI